MPRDIDYENNLEVVKSRIEKVALFNPQREKIIDYVDYCVENDLDGREMVLMLNEQHLEWQTFAIICLIAAEFFSDKMAFWKFQRVPATGYIDYRELNYLTQSVLGVVIDYQIISGIAIAYDAGNDGFTETYIQDKFYDDFWNNFKPRHERVKREYLDAYETKTPLGYDSYYEAARKGSY